MAFYVYLVRDSKSGYLKIGITGNPESRLIDLQAGNPSDLTLLYTLDCLDQETATNTDGLLHRRYANYRIGASEWFCIHASQVIDDLDWCIEMANEIMGGAKYHQYDVRQRSKPIRLPIERRTVDSKQKVRQYLTDNPDAVTMSVRKHSLKSLGVPPASEP